MYRIISSVILTCLFFSYKNGLTQLYVNGGSIFLDSGASVNIKGDLLSAQSISGTGKVIMNGTTGQNLDMGGNVIPSLEIDNSQNVTLNAPLKIQNQLSFVNGKIVAGNNDVTLSSNLTCNGMGVGKMIDISGGGTIFKEVQSNLNNIEIPIGISNAYNPVFITTNATSYQNAKLGISALAVKHPELPVGSTDYLKMYWPITRTGITGNVSVAGQYNNTTDVTGSRNNLIGAYFDGNQWTTSGESHDATLNRVGMPVTGTGGILTGINNGGLVTVKAMIQGYYLGANAMQTTLHDLALNNILNASDSISVGLWSPSALNNTNPNFKFNALMHQNGSATINVPLTGLGNAYYLALKHRNSIETWSSNPIAISNNLSYDFTTGADKAFSDGINPSMKQMPDGKFAFYSGDLNQDGSIDVLDMLPAENDASIFAFGYNQTDCTGDGVTDLSDMIHIENNAGQFIFYARPY